MWAAMQAAKNAPNPDIELNRSAIGKGPLLAATDVTGLSASSADGVTVTIVDGTVTTYDPKIFVGRKTASGETYTGKGMTAAVNPAIGPLGRIFTVTSGDGTTITVTANDIMPNKSMEKGAVLDLSGEAYTKLTGSTDPRDPGRVPVTVTYQTNSPYITQPLTWSMKEMNTPARGGSRGTSP